MIRHLLSLLLALTLATTSVHAAVMHAEMQGAVQMEICADTSGGGVAIITLDATGKPIPTAHRCPDCTAAIAALLPIPPQIAAAPTQSRSARPSHTRETLTSAPPNQSARDPPAFA